MAREFHTWLLFGLIVNAISIVYAILAVYYVASRSRIAQVMANAVGIIMCVGMALLITAGCVARFEFVGRVCSGDFY